MQNIKLAADALKNAYAPYSHFKVGCVVVGTSGRVFTGCNVENASYSATICAERVAIGTAVAQGEKSIRQIFLITSSERPCFPCGVCLQVISEFGNEVEIITASSDQKVISTYKLSELLPHAYDKTFLPTNSPDQG